MNKLLLAISTVAILGSAGSAMAVGCKDPSHNGFVKSQGKNLNGAFVSSFSANLDKGDGNGTEIAILPWLGTDGFFCASGLPGTDSDLNLTGDQTGYFIATDPGQTPPN